VITRPDWSHRPDADALARYFPAFANFLGLGGLARMVCLVNTEGELRDCKIVSEKPTGLGFGEAAIKMAPEFKMRPETLDGAPVSGASVTIPINFAASVSPAAPPSLSPSTEGLDAPSPRALALGRRLATATITGDQTAITLRSSIEKMRANLATAGASPEQRLAVDSLEQATLAVLPSLTERYAQFFARSLSERELMQTLVFMESPAGRSWTALEPKAQSQGLDDIASLAQIILADTRGRLCRQIACVGTPPPGH
jgi:TonB family protein